MLCHSNRINCAALVAAMLFTTALASSAQAGLFSNPTFDNPPGVLQLGDVTRNPITIEAADQWILGGADNGDAWVHSGGMMAANTPGGEAQGMVQWVADGGATTGTQTFEFDFSGVVGSGDYDLHVYAFGWNAGTGPGVDFENGTAETGDSFIPNSSVSIISGITTGTEGRLTLINNGGITAEGTSAGVVLDGSFNTVSVPLDFGTGFDNVGVLFYAENGGTGGSLLVDNADLFMPPVPEPVTASLGLLGLAGLGLVTRRRRSA